MNPARQAALAAGIPDDATAYLVNQVCGSGLRSIAQGYQAIKLGESDIVVAGGQESMSQSSHAANMRTGQKMGDLKYVDTMIKDGLWCATNGYHMGNTAENVAQQWQITRQQQDEFAVASQNKAEDAQKAGKFKDEIVSMTISGRKGDIVVDTAYKTGTTWMQMICALLIFQKPDLGRPLSDISPWLDMRVQDLDEVLAVLERKTTGALSKPTRRWTRSRITTT